GARGAFVNPNSYYNEYGRLDMDRPLVIKLSGTYQAPFDINISAVYTHYSGFPYPRRIRVYYLDPWYSYRTVTTQPYGEGDYREPSRDNLDLRIEKTFDFQAVKVGVFLDVFNALNSGYVDYYARTGYAGRVYYDQPGRWVPNGRFLNEVAGLTAPRVFKLSLRVSF
ncbi:MAG: hypothetical protein JXB23_02480, partial [Candidatus Aminicenantes bacterium]|nr:hypothetical protein [Candidatus Aminicenantes bacterium]